jgi:hypothetical protein
MCYFEICLIVYSRLSYSSFPAAETMTGDRPLNLDPCLALMAFSSEGSFTCQSCCDTRPRFMIQSDPEIPQRDKIPRRKDNQIVTPSLLPIFFLSIKESFHSRFSL